jgi:hypothetical protein
MDIDKPHAAGEPSHRVSNAFLPTAASCLLPPMLEESLNISFDDVRKIR